MKIKTQKEILREKGYTERDIRHFYLKKEKLAKMNVRYTIEHFEQERSLKNDNTRNTNC